MSSGLVPRPNRVYAVSPAALLVSCWVYGGICWAAFPYVMIPRAKLATYLAGGVSALDVMVSQICEESSMRRTMRLFVAMLTLTALLLTLGVAVAQDKKILYPQAAVPAPDNTSWQPR